MAIHVLARTNSMSSIYKNTPLTCDHDWGDADGVQLLQRFVAVRPDGVLEHHQPEEHGALLQLVLLHLLRLQHQLVRFTPRAGEMIPEVEGTRPWGPRGKGSLSVSKGPKPPIQLLQLLKNSPREAKRAHFRYILGPLPPVPPRRWNYWGPEGKVPPGPPRFLQPCNHTRGIVGRHGQHWQAVGLVLRTRNGCLFPFNFGLNVLLYA